MTRCEMARDYHEKGYNCAQSVLAPFADVLGLSVEQCMNMSSGFGRGAGTKELCGTISGAILVMSMLNPVDPENPVVSKRRTVTCSQKLQRRFVERFGSVRCGVLLDDPSVEANATDKAKATGMPKSCDGFILSVVDLLEELLDEMKILEKVEE